MLNDTGAFSFSRHRTQAVSEDEKRGRSQQQQAHTSF
jgi:hypothetical protein